MFPTLYTLDIHIRFNINMEQPIVHGQTNKQTNGQTLLVTIVAIA